MKFSPRVFRKFKFEQILLNTIYCLFWSGTASLSLPNCLDEKLNRKQSETTNTLKTIVFHIYWSGCVCITIWRIVHAHKGTELLSTAAAFNAARCNRHTYLEAQQWKNYTKLEEISVQRVWIRSQKSWSLFHLKYRYHRWERYFKCQCNQNVAVGSMILASKHPYGAKSPLWREAWSNF